MTRNDQQPTCIDAACGNQTLNNQTLPRGVLPMEGHQKKYNIQSDIRALLIRDCEVDKVMRFLKNLEVFEEI